MSARSPFGKRPRPGGGRPGAGRQSYRPVGKMGRSQAVTTFGIGSIYELRTFRNGKATLHSVMIAGLEAWQRYQSQLQVVREDVLARMLGVEYFLLPPSEPERSSDPDPAVIPAVRFPEVLYCDVPKCGRVGRTGQEFQDRDFGGPKCNAAGCIGRGVPFRFVIACHDKKDPNQPGHIDDFPYVFWAHRGGRCANPAVYLVARAGSTGLAGLALECRACDAPAQSMESIFLPGALHIKCSGRRPWLHDREDGCQRPVQVLQRGASNIYYAVTPSAISIPPYSDRLFTLVDRALNASITAAIRTGAMSPQNAVAICRQIPGLDDPDVFSEQQIVEAIAIRSGVMQISLPSSQADLRHQERNAIVRGRIEDWHASDFVAVPVADLGSFPELASYFDCVVRVHRLREVRALRGFQRVDAGQGGDSYTSAVAPLSKKKFDWLPGLEVRGEGIYLELKRSMVLAWQATPHVVARRQLLAANLASACAQNDWPPAQPPSAAEILVHTFSHLLMKQLSLECGYSGNSLRERIYVSEHDGQAGYAGVLIYTASPGADGTLGGLVGQGEPARLLEMLKATLLSTRWCSSDPLCSESKGQGVDALNLSACHACALVGETSCEKRNLYLDRWLVTGSSEAPQAGFFAELLSQLD